MTVFPFLLKPIFDNATLEISNHFMPISNISQLTRNKRKRTDGKGYNSANTITCPLCLKKFYKNKNKNKNRNTSVNTLCISENPAIYPPPNLSDQFHEHFKHCQIGEDQNIRFPPSNELQFERTEVINTFSHIYKHLIFL